MVDMVVTKAAIEVRRGGVQFCVHGDNGRDIKVVWLLHHECAAIIKLQAQRQAGEGEWGHCCHDSKV